MSAMAAELARAEIALIAKKAMDAARAAAAAADGAAADVKTPAADVKTPPPAVCSMGGALLAAGVGDASAVRVWDLKSGAALYSMGAPPPPGARRLHLNEYRFEHHPAVLAAAALAPDDLTCYSTAPCATLKKALVEYLGDAVDEANILVAAGSDEILRAATLFAARAGLPAVVAGVPTYGHLEVFAGQAGLAWAPVHLASIGDRTNGCSPAVSYEAGAGSLMAAGALVYIATPNNPTGATWSPVDLHRLAARHPASLFLVDEAYVEFESVCENYVMAKAEGPAATTTIASLRRGAASPKASESVRGELTPMPEGVGRRTMGGGCSLAAWATFREAKTSSDMERIPANIIVSRTFSKAFGLAGMRIGYAVGAPALVAKLAPYISDKTVSRAAARAAAAALANVDHYYAAAWAAAEARVALAEFPHVYATGGNFALLHVSNDGDTAPFLAAAKAAGLHVRDRSDQPGLAGFVRLTVGGGDDMEAVWRLLKAYKFPADPPLQVHYTPKGVIASLRTMYGKVVGVLEGASDAFEDPITWWATDGTLLGALRHGGIVPWDDDIDLGYLYQDVPSEARVTTDAKAAPAPTVDPLAKLAGAFAKAGLTLQRNRTNAYWQVGTNKPGAAISATHIDLFPYILVDGVYVNADPRFQKPDATQKACNTTYTPAELLPLAAAPWYGGTIPAPAGGAASLDRVAPGWRARAVVRGRTAPYPMKGHAWPA